MRELGCRPGYPEASVSHFGRRTHVLVVLCESGHLLSGGLRVSVKVLWTVGRSVPTTTTRTFEDSGTSHYLPPDRLD